MSKVYWHLILRKRTFGEDVTKVAEVKENNIWLSIHGGCAYNISFDDKETPREDDIDNAK